MARAGTNARFLLERIVVVYRQRRVVREPLLLVDRDALRLRGDLRRPDLVVDAPPDVLFPRLAPVRPPRVLLRARVDPTEDVDPFEILEHARKPFPLLGKEARVLPVASPV